MTTNATPADVNETAQPILQDDGTPPPDAPPPPEPTKDEEVSGIYAKIAKREKRLLEKERELKEQLPAIKEYKERQALKAANLIEWINAEGVKPEDLVEAIIASGAPKSVKDEALERVEKLEREIAEQKEADEKRKDDEFVAVLETAKSIRVDELQKVAGANPEKFKLTLVHGDWDAIINYESEWYAFQIERSKKDPEKYPADQINMLDPEKLLTHIEDTLRQQYEPYARALTPPAPPPEPTNGAFKTEDSKRQDRKSPLKTLTNTSASPSVSQTKVLTESERLKRAAAKLVYR